MRAKVDCFTASTLTQQQQQQQQPRSERQELVMMMTITWPEFNNATITTAACDHD